jgi:branched-chain amino acid transport system ATP-binding protein
MISIRGLRVRFGGITPLDGVDVDFPPGVCGLVGPNGAGKTTLFNVLSGFVSPTEGTVVAFGDDLLSMTDHRRAGWGLRRTFQQEQAIEDLSVGDNVAVVHEHSGAPRLGRAEAVRRAVEFVGIEDRIDAPVAALGAKERRLVEMARAVVGKPRMILLDEPAAGLPADETNHLQNVILQIPERIGATVILVDHDIDLVSATCWYVVVLDFGKLIASGETEEVLRDERVVKAYLGDQGESRERHG